MGGKSKSITIGYRYFMGLFMGICHECDVVLEIIAAERSAWKGESTGSGYVYINAPNLFGGDDKEGGLAGQLTVQMGRATQNPNEYLEQQLGSPQPAYRGFLSLIYTGQVAVLNPYIKAWAVRVRSILAGWEDDTPWYPDKASIAVVAGYAVAPDADGWSYQILPEESDPGYENLTIPTSGWTDYVQAPFAGGDFASQGNTEWPLHTVLWAKRASISTGIHPGGVLRVSAENGCLVFLNGELKGVINRDNVDLVGQPPDYVFPMNFGSYYDLVIKAFDETTKPLGNTLLKVEVSYPTRQAMNPAHIIYQSLTNSDWGMGYPTATIDDANFTAAADLFFSEGLGLSLNWNNQTTIEAFLQIVADHASLSFGQDRRTGLFRILPLRGDYIEDDLPVFTKDDVRVISYQRPSLADTVNEIIIQYTDTETGKDATTSPLQNLANIQGQGRVVSQTLSFPGIPTHELATRVGIRELEARSTPLWKFQLEFKRGAATYLMPGEPWILDLLDTEIGVRLVMRAGEMDYGNTSDGVVRAPCIEDVFGFPAAAYIGNPGGGGALPDTSPKTALSMAFEAPHVEVVRSLSQADFDALPSTACFAAVVSPKPAGSQISFSLYTRVSPDPMAKVAGGDFAPSCVSTAALAPGETALVYDLDTATDMNLIEAGTGAFLGEGTAAELVRVDAVDETTGTVTLARGCADTVPAKQWPVGTRLWVYEEADAVDPTKYVEGDTVDTIVAPIAPGGELPLDFAPIVSVTMASRRQRPYPPGKLRIAGAAYPATVAGAFTVTWAHRNRDTQGDVLVDTSEASVTPAPNTRYTLRFLDAGGALLVEQAGIGPGTAAVVLNYTGDVTLELFTVDDVSTSWQKHVHEFAYTPPAGTVVTAITATAYTPEYDGIIVDGGA